MGTGGDLASVSSAGALNWKIHVSGTFNSGPAVTADGSIYILNKAGVLFDFTSSGVRNWKTTISDSFDQCTPAVDASGKVYLISTAGKVYCLSKTGTLAWSNGTYASGYRAGSLSIGSDGTLYGTTGFQGVFAIKSDGTSGWRTFVPGGFQACCPVVSPNGNILVCTYDGYVSCLDSAGNLLWYYTTGDHINGGLCLASDGTIYVANETGGLQAISPTGSLIWTAPLRNTDRMYCTPAIRSDGVVIVAGADQGFITAIGTEVTTVPLASVSVDQAAVAGGSSATGTVTLTGTAPDGGDIVLLSSNNSSATVPTFVLVPGGQNTATFTINTTVPASDSTATITASSGGVSQTSNLIVQVYGPASLSLSPSTIVGSVNSSTATVTLNQVAPVGGLTLSVNSQWPAFVNMPATVTIPEGSNSATFTISSAKMWEIAFTDWISVTYGAASRLSTLTVATTALQSVTVNPSTVHAGGSATVTLTLGGPAPVGGWPVTIASSLPFYVPMPSVVTVPEGQTSATFTVTPSKSTPSGTVQISAHDSVIYHSGNLVVQNDGISSLTLNPTSISAGTSSTATVTLSSAAPAGGWTVNVRAGAPSQVTVPSTVTVPEGAVSASFTISTSVSSSSINCGIYVSDASSSASSTLNVVGDSITAISLSPTVIGGNSSTTATVTLSGPASNGGWTVNLSAGVPSAVSMPSSVVVPAGATSTTFTINGRQLASTYTLGMYASDRNSSKSTSLTVTGDQLTSLTVNPGSVTAGKSTTGTVTVSSPAPVGGWLVQLTAAVPSEVTVPSSVLIPAGSTSANFTISTKVMSGNLTSGIYATDGTTRKSTTFTIYGDYIVSLSLNPTTVVGGTTSTGTVTLATAAPAGGWTVTLRVGDATTLTVPASIVIPAGSTSADFTINSKTVTSTKSILVFATDSNSGASNTLTVTQ
jgi:hypothetical protein